MRGQGSGGKRQYSPPLQTCAINLHIIYTLLSSSSSIPKMANAFLFNLTESLGSPLSPPSLLLLGDSVLVLVLVLALVLAVSLPLPGVSGVFLPPPPSLEFSPSPSDLGGVPSSVVGGGVVVAVATFDVSSGPGELVFSSNVGEFGESVCCRCCFVSPSPPTPPSCSLSGSMSILMTTAPLMPPSGSASAYTSGKFAHLLSKHKINFSH